MFSSFLRPTHHLMMIIKRNAIIPSQNQILLLLNIFNIFKTHSLKYWN